MMRQAIAGGLLFVTLCLTPSVARTEEPPRAPSSEAPFGLTWLMSKRGLDALGIEPTSGLATPFGDSCVVSRLPKELADQQYAVLSFGENDRLIRIVAVGGGFAPDPSGDRISLRYAEIQQLLERKYGTGKSERHTEKQLDGDRFALGLQTKRNWMYTEYSPDQMRVELSVFWETGKTYWRVIFEHRPGMEQLKGQHRATDQNAF